MELLYGTGNLAKLSAMKHKLEKLDIELIGLNDLKEKGFPLDSLSIDIKTNKYYYNLPEDRLEQVAVEDGFLEFFEKILDCG